MQEVKEDRAVFVESTANRARFINLATKNTHLVCALGVELLL